MKKDCDFFVIIFLLFCISKQVYNLQLVWDTTLVELPIKLK